jgi:undecaprenyl-diphosphatase
LAAVLDRIVDLLRPYLEPPWGYAIVFAATFLENSVGAGVIVPGETLVIIGGFYARIGDLWLPGVATVAIVGAVLGDNLGYWIGRRYGRGFLERHGRRLFVTPERLEAAEGYYRRYGGRTVFLGRFIPVVRSVGFIVAGVAHMGGALHRATSPGSSWGSAIPCSATRSGQLPALGPYGPRSASVCWRPVYF